MTAPVIVLPVIRIEREPFDPLGRYDWAGVVDLRLVRLARLMLRARRREMRSLLEAGGE